jgi:integrase/recombinase XerD
MQATDRLILNEQSQTVNTLFDQFTKELKYLRNLSERTIFSYRDAFERWLKFVGAMPTERNLSQFVLGMREAGLSITSCSIYIRSVNSFLTWLKDNGHCPQTFSNGKPFKLAKLPEEKKQLRVFDDADIHKILSFKPKGRNDHRIYALLCTLIDTGIRINEALNLEIDRVDFDNLIITVTKGI